MKFATVPIELLLPPSNDIRFDDDTDCLWDLAASLKKIGFLHPIVVREKGGKYEIVCGHRRYKAARLANILEVPVYVIEGADEVVDFAKIHENVHRRDINALEEAKYFDLLMARYNYTLRDVAKLANRSEAYVKARIDLLQYPEDIQEAVRNGSIVLGVARYLAQIDDATTRRYFLESAIDGGCTVRTAEKWYADYLSSKGKPVPAKVVERLQEEASPPVDITAECVACRKRFSLDTLYALRVCWDCYRALQKASEEGELKQEEE